MDYIKASGASFFDEIAEHVGMLPVEAEEALAELVALTYETTNCDACLVYLVDRATNEVVLQASQLPHAEEIGNIRLKMGEGITGWVAQHKSVVALSSKASADARFKTFQTLPEDTFDAFLSVPLVSGGDLIGVINVHHRAAHSHRPEEVALVSFIGEQMGGAIAKSRLEERAETAVKRMEALAAVAQTIAAENYLDRILHAGFAGVLHHADRRGPAGAGDFGGALLVAGVSAQDAAEDRRLADRPRGAGGPPHYHP